MACNCGGIRHEYTAEYLEKKAKQKVLEEIARKQKEKEKNGKMEGTGRQD